MKKEPCIRLGMRISPKIREKPEESRNSRPPSAMLLTAKVSHKFIRDRLGQIGCVAPEPPARPWQLARTLQSRRPTFPVQAPLVFQILGRRIIARVDRVRQEVLLVVGPELAD